MKISHDVNGNKVLSISGSDLGNSSLRGFSVQTLGNLPQTHRMSKWDLNSHTAMNELNAFIKVYGTARQKDLLGW